MRTHGTWLLVLLLGISISFFLLLAPPQQPVGDSNKDTAAPAQVDTGSWYRYTPHHWPHDGAPLGTEHFTIYSDVASDREKQRVASLAERALTEIETLLGIDDRSIYDFPAGQEKIDIYLARARKPAWGGWAYYGGFLLTAKVCGWLGCERSVVAHELMHVVGYLLEGYRETDRMYTDVWFDEGLAEYVSGVRRIESLREYKRRQARLLPYLENGNPIRVHRWDDILSAEQGAFGGDDSFAMFELAVRYLIDEGGLGKTAEDAKRVFLDIRAGLSFADAFENRFGMSLAEYEASFDSLMQEYLD